MGIMPHTRQMVGRSVEAPDSKAISTPSLRAEIPKLNSQHWACYAFRASTT